MTLMTPMIYMQQTWNFDHTRVQGSFGGKKSEVKRVKSASGVSRSGSKIEKKIKMVIFEKIKKSQKKLV